MCHAVDGVSKFKKGNIGMKKISGDMDSLTLKWFLSICHDGTNQNQLVSNQGGQSGYEWADEAP
jgi:hypothetical protein